MLYTILVIWIMKLMRHYWNIASKSIKMISRKYGIGICSDIYELKSFTGGNLVLNSGFAFVITTVLWLTMHMAF